MIGFATKGNAKRALENNFIEGEDYKIIESKQENTNLLIPRDKQTLCENRGGHNEENILLNVDTFKNLCMITKTEKSKKIRKYYIKLEQIFNEIVNQQRIDFEEKMKQLEQEKNNTETQLKNLEEELESKDVELERKEILLKKKEKQIKDLTNKVSDGYVYVGVNEGIEGASRIGITENILKRNDSHLSSNPGFKFVFTHRTKNNKLIENCIKSMLSPFVYNKAEWYSMSHEDLIYIVKFFIELFDTHNGAKDVKNIVEFLRQLRQKNIIVKETHEFIPSNIYAQFFEDCIEFRKTTGHIGKLENTYKCPFIRLQEKLDEWLTKNNYSFPIKTETEPYRLPDPSPPCAGSRRDRSTESVKGNYTHAFRDDIQAYVKAQFNKEIETINLICKKNNIRCSSYLGYIGFRIKDDFVSTFYPDSVYSRFINERIVVDNTTNTTKKEIAEAFEQWTKANQVFSSYERDPSSSKVYFYDEITKAVHAFTGIAPSKKVTNKRFNGYPGFRGLAIKF